MAISIGSINTGLPKNIVQKLIEAERIPLKNMEAQKQKFTDKMGLLDKFITFTKDLRDTLTQNKTPQNFKELNTTFRDDIVNITADKNIARSGSHQIEVIQLAQKSSALSNGFKDPEGVFLGVGYFSYRLPDGTKREVYINEENSSLKGFAKLINKDKENKMSANVIHDGSDNKNPWRLLIALEDTGDKNRASFPNFYLLDNEQEFTLEEQRDARDAKIKLDGFEIEVQNNKINKLIPGVTIDLKKAAPGEEFTIKIQEDTTKTTKKVSSIVDKINAVLNFIGQQNAIDENTDTSRTLSGDITLTNFENQIKNIIFRSYRTESGHKRFSDIGVSFQRDGLLKFDEQKFSSEMEENPVSINQMLTGIIEKDGQRQEGLIEQLSNMLEVALRSPDGMITSRKKGIQSRIKQVDRRIEDRQRIIDQKEKNLKNKFAKLESTISKIKAQGSSLQSITGGVGAQSNINLG